MGSKASKQSATKSKAKHYNSVETLIVIANLLPWSIHDGERYVRIRSQLLPEGVLPNTELLRQLAQSAVQVTLLKDLKRAAAHVGQKTTVKDLADMIPLPGQHRILKTVHERFLRQFAGERIAIGESVWNLGGDPLKVYHLYAAVREILAAIAAPRWRLGNIHTVTLTLPSSIHWAQLVWDHRQPAIHIVPDIVLDGVRGALAGLDPGRIKRCPECGTFFLARRLDKSACSPRCSNLVRVHRHRARQPKYEYNRKLKKAGVTIEPAL
jgi:hypothetical protein